MGRFRRKCRDVEAALTRLGFTQEPSKSGGSHTKWSRVVDGHKRKVALDCHRGEVSARDVRSIIKQAGVSLKEFEEACD